MIAYMGANFGTKFWVQILVSLNTGIYSLIKVFCQVFMDISNVTLFDESTISGFTDRIYVILGIYMLFKIAISLLGSIVDPNKLLDKEHGLQKIIPRTVMALAMLVLVPSIFELALGWQSDIAEAVPRIIIGVGTGSSSDMGERGERLAATALKAFIVPNNECSSDLDLAQDALDGTSSISTTLDLPLNTCTSAKDVFRYEFNGFISIIVGIFMLISVASYCIDVAIRVIKLGLLRILAPIPIISYIDPKSEKQGAFGNWVKECISTYAELFIKLAVLYFVIYILSSIATDEASMFGNIGDTSTSLFIKMFIIVGAFFFMGKAAEFICNIVGIKYNKSAGGVMGKTLSFLGKGLAGAGLGAAGSLLTGGGLAGMASGALEGMATGTTGKPGAAFNKGRDISAQMKTGNPNAKHKGLLTKAGERVRARRAANLGFTADTVDAAKKTMFQAKDAAADAEALRSRFNGSNMTDADVDLLTALRGDSTYNQDDNGNKLDDAGIIDRYVNKTRTNANKAETYYNDAKAYAGVLGVRTSEPLASKFNPKGREDDEKSKREQRYTAIARNAQARHVQEGSKGFVSDKHAPKTFNVASSVGQTTNTSSASVSSGASVSAGGASTPNTFSNSDDMASVISSSERSGISTIEQVESLYDDNVPSVAEHNAKQVDYSAIFSQEEKRTNDLMNGIELMYTYANSPESLSAEQTADVEKFYANLDQNDMDTVSRTIDYMDKLDNSLSVEDKIQSAREAFTPNYVHMDVRKEQMKQQRDSKNNNTSSNDNNNNNNG